MRVLLCELERHAVQKILRFLVLAGRPVGGTEGMVLHRLQVGDGALKAFGSMGEGVSAVIACMKRHQSHAAIQAMACWSMVNLALIPDQRRLLVHQGGIQAIIKAMADHPGDSEVHFRAIFALVNLVTPDVTSESSIPTDTMKVRNCLQSKVARDAIHFSELSDSLRCFSSRHS